MTSTLRSILFFLFVLAASLGYSQAPNISYTSPQVYTVASPISSLSPVNSGGVVPAPTPVTLAAGFNNPTGIAVDGPGNVYIAENGNSDVKEIPVGGGSILTLGSGFNHPTGVAVDAAGNVYVVDNGNNAVKEIPAGGGAIITLGSGFNGPYGVAIDASGNLYVGDANNNEVKKIPAGGGTPIVIGTGFNHPTGVAVDASGNVYVADRTNNEIKKILAAGGSTVLLAIGNGNPNGVAVDKNGNVYFADTNVSTITEIPAGGGNVIVVGSGFSNPTDVALDAHLNVYVADNGNTAVKEVGYGGYSITPQLPEGLSFDTTTGIISGTPAAASPATNYTVTAFNASGSSMAIINITVNLPPKPVISYNTPQTYTTLVSISSLSPVNSGGAVQTTGGYSINPALPAGLAFDINSGIISGTPTAASPAANYTVTAVNSGGSSTATINIKVNPYPVPVISYKTPQVYVIGQPVTPLMPTSSGVAPYNSSNSVTLASGFNNLTGIAIDGSGNVYVAENGSDAIDKIPAGSGTYAAIGSGFNHPTGVAVDAAGNVYVADNGNNAVKEIPVGGGAIITLGSGFNSPYGVAVDASGNIYIGDSNNNAVKKIPAGSNTPIIIGSGFNHPTGVAVDAAGNVYVADRGNNMIKKILAAGGSTVTLGNGDGNPNGVAADSQGNVYFADTNESSIIEIPAAGGGYINIGSGFITPTAVAVNGSNIVYIGDNGNQAVKEIQQVGGYSISPALPAGLSFDNSTGIISGTPTANSPATNYTVMAYNIGGSGSTTLNISVVTPNAGLANLTLSSGVLSPAFSTPTTGYTVAETNSTTTITVTPTASDAGSTLTVNGTAVASGFASPAIPLTLGANTIKVIVTSSNQTIIGVYTLSVNRALSSNAHLAGLSVSSGTLNPTFTDAITNYTVYLPNSTASISVTPTVADATAAITVNGSPVASEGASAPIALNAGNNIITTVVTAQDGITTDTYTITADRAGAAAENLSALTLSSGTLSPVFGAGANGYTANVASATTSITVTPTIGTATSTITVNGVAVTSGTASMPVHLNTGANVISVVVTEQDGVTKNTYTVTVTRPPSSDAALSKLTINSGTLNPAFASGTTSYSATVSNATTSITVTPTTDDPSATGVTVNGIAVTSGSASGAITLNVGSNKITTIVTASDGVTKKTYTITVSRESGNDNLSALTISSGTLSPAFAASTKTYTTTVANSVASVTVTPTTSDPSATGVTVNGIAVTSGATSGPVNLNVGSNKITIIVTAHDPSFTKTYTITVTRESGNDNLSALTLSSGTLSPVFASGTKTYTASVGNSVSSLTVTPTTSDASATGVTVNGISVKSGKASGPVALSVGQNVINIIVTAHDPSFTKTYTITVTRAPAANANLANLSMSAGILSPAFASQTTSYTATVANSVASLTETPTTSDPAATLTVNGIAVTSGAASGAIALNVGSNTITTIVTALDGVTKKTYRITVTRESGNDNLSALTISSGTLSPIFSSGTKAYTASVANSVSSLTATPTTTDPSATGVTVNGKAVKSGTASGAIALIAGPNTITIIVTARDPSFTKTYTVTVTRAPSANAILAGLSISAGALSPAFAAQTTAYTASVGNGVTSLTLTPATSNSGATVTVNGAVVTSGSASGPIALNAGQNTITTIVTAQNGTTKKTYTVTVTRAPSANAFLSSLSISTGALSPAFATQTTAYAVTVANSVASAMVTPVTSDPGATVTLNGMAVSSGSASGPVALNVGSNSITTIVTAQDGTTKKTYTITVNRESGNDNLSALTLSSGALSPAFASGTKTYSASVANGVSSLTVTPTTSDPSATGVTVNGATVTSGTVSGPVGLSVGPNTITIIVTAHDPSFTKTYTVTVTRASGGNNPLYQQVSVETPPNSPQLADDGITVHSGVSPNGDGIDDFLQIDNITSYPDNRLTIMNRNGMLVYEAKGYDNISRIFDGHSNKTGQLQLPGTYFYQLDYTVKGETKHKTGFLVLKY